MALQTLALAGLLILLVGGIKEIVQAIWKGRP